LNYLPTTRLYIAEDLDVEEFIGAVIGGTPPKPFFLLKKGVMS
jgi:hypothetical protein